MGQTYPVTVIAKLLDLTPRRVQQLSGDGVIPKAERGRYELVPSVRGYIKYLRDRAIAADNLPEDAGRNGRARLVKAQAEAQEMENAKERGDLLPATIVEREWTDTTFAFKSRMISIPGKAAPQVVSCNSIPEVKAILEGMIFEALEELSRGDYARGDGDDTASPGIGPEGGISAPEDYDQPVGGPAP